MKKEIATMSVNFSSLQRNKVAWMLSAAIVVLSIMLITSGCGSASPSSSAPLSSTTPPATTSAPVTQATPPAGYVSVKSADGNVTVFAPSGWNTNDTALYPGSVIGVADSATNQFFIVLEKPKSSLAQGATVNDYLNLAKTAFDAVLTGPTWGKASNVTIGGCKGLSLQLTGTRKSNSSNTTYYVNLLESKNYFYNVCGYTLTASADANRASLQTIINSFREKD
jgi:hypothetical protein